MEKITKKSFNELHKANKLWLVAGMVKLDCFATISRLTEIDISQLNPIKTTSIDTGSQSSTGTIVTVYKATIQGRVFYIVEDNIDHSKDNYTSRNNTEIFSTIYIEK